MTSSICIYVACFFKLSKSLKYCTITAVTGSAGKNSNIQTHTLQQTVTVFHKQMQHFSQKLSLTHSRRPTDPTHANTPASALRASTAQHHTNSALIQLNTICVLISRSVFETQRLNVSECDCITHPAVSVSFYLRHAAPASPLTTDALLQQPLVSPQPPHPPTSLSFPLSPPNSHQTHHSALCPYGEFQRCTVCYSSCRGTVPPNEPQRGCRRILHRGPYWLSQLTYCGCASSE